MTDLTPLELFGEAMRRFPAAVSIITTHDGDAVAGVTATAVTSFTANPPSMLCSVGHTTQSHALLHECRRFAINILHLDQAEMALAFGRSDPAKFTRDEYALDATFDVPIILGSLATLVCDRAATYSHYDHSILIGDVVGGYLDVTQEPLVYTNREFWALVGHPPEARPA